MDVGPLRTKHQGRPGTKAVRTRNQDQRTQEDALHRREICVLDLSRSISVELALLRPLCWMTGYSIPSKSQKGVRKIPAGGDISGS